MVEEEVEAIVDQAHQLEVQVGVEMEVQIVQHLLPQELILVVVVVVVMVVAVVMLEEVAADQA
tara:strand:+ start:295 stop:483 length:189 start_codon:yes stop_codon:yes gene_type:complete